MEGGQRALVAYATAAGSTARTADRIAAVLRTAGCEATCRSAGPELDPAGFNALVVGSAVRNMAWLPTALEVVRRAAVTSSRPVWCFSVGGGEPAGGTPTSREAERLDQQFPPIHSARASGTRWRREDGWDPAAGPPRLLVERCPRG